MDAARIAQVIAAAPVAVANDLWGPGDADEFHPGDVLDLVRDHDNRMQLFRDEMEEHKAAYMTAWWDWALRDGKKSRKYGYTNAQCIEVNRVWGGVETHAAQLSPRSRRAVIGRDELGRGNAKVFQSCLNAWWRQRGQLERITAAIRMATLYPGSGFKVRLLAGRGNPVERVELSVLPPWELVLDYNSGDVAQERFRGHVYWTPVSKLIAAHPQLEGRVQGVGRDDFLRPARTGSTSGVAAGSSGPSDVSFTSNVRETEYPSKRKNGKKRSGSFVRVLEFYNLVDGFDAGDGVTLQGRLELYALDQGDADLQSYPFEVRAIPFASADGIPLGNPVPMVFAHEPEFMLRAISPLRRYMPQQRELNLYRSEMAKRTQKHVRKVFVRESDWNSDNKSKYANTTDMEVISLKGDVNPAQAVYVTPPPPPDSEFKEYMALVERDLDRVQAISPNRSGQVTKATAYEIQSVNLFDETEFGKHAVAVNSACEQISQLVRAALLLAIQQAADSEGGYETLGANQKVAANAVVEGDSSAAVDAVADDNAEATGKAAVGVAGEALGATGGPPAVATSATAGAATVVAQQSFSVLDPESDQMVAVTPPALDANFTITFVEGVQTPMTDQAQQQNLLAIEPMYMGLWKVAQTDTPDALLARRFMASIHDKLKLPADMHPDKLLAAWQDEQKKGAEAAPPPKEAVAATKVGPSDGEKRLGAAIDAVAKDAAAAGADGVVAALGDAATALASKDVQAIAIAIAKAHEAASMGGMVELEAKVLAIMQATGMVSAEPSPGEPEPVPNEQGGPIAVI